MANVKKAGAAKPPNHPDIAILCKLVEYRYVQALITDLDGTVVDSGDDGSTLSTNLSEIVRQAERWVKKSRAPPDGAGTTKPVVRRLGITAPCIIEGGARIIDPVTEETIWEKVLDEHTSQLVLEAFKRLSSGVNC